MKHRPCPMLYASGAILAAVLLAASGPANAFDPADYEEDAGLGFSLFRSTDGEVYGGGFESGVWLKGTPVFGELFGHWLSNGLLEANYYSIGMTLRVMPRWSWAPFAGGGGSYNRWITGTSSHDGRHLASSSGQPPRSYWKVHVEAGLRIWFGRHGEWFLESGLRTHWTDTAGDTDYDWVSLKYGRLF